MVPIAPHDLHNPLYLNCNNLQQNNTTYFPVDSALIKAFSGNRVDLPLVEIVGFVWSLLEVAHSLAATNPLVNTVEQIKAIIAAS